MLDNTILFSNHVKFTCNVIQKEFLNDHILFPVQFQLKVLNENDINCNYKHQDDEKVFETYLMKKQCHNSNKISTT
jgi:hypothetical protein